MFGLSADKLIVVAVIALILLGPDRLPRAAAAFGRIVRTLRTFAQDASGRLRDEVGPEFDDIDWTRLDPRRYDPRRIVREALAAPVLPREGADRPDDP